MSEVKRIRHAQEVTVADGKRAMLIMFDDGEWTWSYVEHNDEVSALTELIGQTVMITADKVGTIH